MNTIGIPENTIKKLTKLEKDIEKISKTPVNNKKEKEKIINETLNLLTSSIPKGTCSSNEEIKYGETFELLETHKDKDSVLLIKRILQKLEKLLYNEGYKAPNDPKTAIEIYCEHNKKNVSALNNLYNPKNFYTLIKNVLNIDKDDENTSQTQTVTQTNSTTSSQKNLEQESSLKYGVLEQGKTSSMNLLTEAEETEFNDKLRQLRKEILNKKAANTEKVSFKSDIDSVLTQFTQSNNHLGFKDVFNMELIQREISAEISLNDDAIRARNLLKTDPMVYKKSKLYNDKLQEAKHDPNIDLDKFNKLLEEQLDSSTSSTGFDALQSLFTSFDVHTYPTVLRELLEQNSTTGDNFHENLRRLKELNTTKYVELMYIYSKKSNLWQFLIENLNSKVELLNKAKMIEENTKITQQVQPQEVQPQENITNNLNVYPDLDQLSKENEASKVEILTVSGNFNLEQINGILKAQIASKKISPALDSLSSMLKKILNYGVEPDDFLQYLLKRSKESMNTDFANFIGNLHSLSNLDPRLYQNKINEFLKEDIRWTDCFIQINQWMNNIFDAEISSSQKYSVANPEAITVTS